MYKSPFYKRAQLDYSNLTINKVNATLISHIIQIDYIWIKQNVDILIWRRERIMWEKYFTECNSCP